MQADETASPPDGETRRTFLKQTLGLAAAGVAAPWLTGCATVPHPAPTQNADAPWYRRACRWGQTNITELDPTRYDIAWWRQYWKQTEVQGVIINAGGIIAYYPSKFPLHQPAQFLNGRDLFGDLARAARADGLVVLARMDSSRAHEPFYHAHPDWFAMDADGRPFRRDELYTACVNGPYYREYLPDVLREIIERNHPEGITDNSWSGLTRDNICYCENCATKFHASSSHDLPREKNWDNPVYRQWIQWSYACRLEIWDLNNRVTKAAGGPDCLWLGMNGGSITGQSQNFRDTREICRRSEIVMLDHQARSNAGGFQNNGLAGKLIHGLLGWDKLIPESMGMYQAGQPQFRFSSKPEPEARLWMLDGFAGGIQPWWHHLGAYQEDRRMFHTAAPLFQWHKANQEFLLHREPVATVGIVWSQQNTDFYGRDNPDELVDLPFRGITNALMRARIPFLPVNIAHVDRDAAKFSVLILPDIAAMSDAECASIHRFVERGGALIATGMTSLCDEWGGPRADYALAGLFGAHLAGDSAAANSAALRRSFTETRHSYLRLSPELRARVDGPRSADEPPIPRERHPVLRGFDETNLLPFGGLLEPLQLDERAEVLMTFVPAFPVTPPETVWMREPRTRIPGLVLNTLAGGRRVAFLPADLDRRYGRDNLPDHASLLANLVRWAARDEIPLSVEGHGLIDCHLYRQPGRMVLHLVNLSNSGAWRAPVDELIPIGPLRVKVRIPPDLRPGKLQYLVSNEKPSLSIHDHWATFEIKSLLDHEVVVI